MAERILSLDFGEKYIGVAISDELGLLAHPLTTIPVETIQSAIEAIGQIAVEHECEHVVIGLPLRTDGTKGPEAKRVQGFAQALHRKFPHLELRLYDERYSTQEADEKLKQRKSKRGHRKKRIDRSAAAVILQRFLDENIN